MRPSPFPHVHTGRTQLFHSPPWALLLLIGLKISIDLRAHLKEHRRQQAAQNPAALP